MKKLFFVAAAMAAIFASCTKEVGPSAEVAADSAVSFGVYTGKATTKATVVTTDVVKADGIGVFAFEQEQAPISSFAKANFQPNFMYNQNVNFNGTSWVYAPVKYWPNNPGAMCTFYAYAPYQSDFDGDTYIETPETNSFLTDVVPNANNLRLILGYDYNGPGIEYNVSTDATKGVDLMWGAQAGTDPAVCPKDILKPSIDTKIEFVMKHALSRLAFTFQVVNDVVAPVEDGGAIAENTTINVKRVSLVGKFANRGTLRLYDGSWNISNSDYANSIEFTPADFNEVIADGVVEDEAATKINLLKGELGTDYIMAIPQGTNGKFYIEIEYDVVTVDPANSKNNSTVTNIINTLPTGGGSTENVSGTEAFDANGYLSLKQGYAYDFNLVLGMTTVKFDVSVEDWNESENNVYLPNNNS